MKGGTMNGGHTLEPMDVLRKFITIFTTKGWLNQGLRIMHRDRRYRIYCSESEFLAYRIKDHCNGSRGFPGWFVCSVTQDPIIEDASMCTFTSDEPSVNEWLCCITEGRFEII
jgi:hypothetical protein